MPKTLTVHPKDARAIAAGHPWVYRQALSRKAQGVNNGTAVDLTDHDGRFLGRGIYDPDDSVAVRVWTQDERVQLDTELIQARLAQAVALREACGIPQLTQAYRVVNAEGDRMPGLILDRFGDWLALTIVGKGLQSRLRTLAKAALDAVPAKGIYYLDERRAELLRGQPAPSELVVDEPSGRFVVDLTEPGKAGLFMDMREVRTWLAPRLAGRRFLNLFAHTGAFSGVAARAGATEVVSVDLSARFLETAERNVELCAPGYGAHEMLCDDVFKALNGLAKHKRRFDAILIDPPSFSNSKRKGAFSVKDSYRPAVRAALRLLEPGGLLICATNWRGIDQSGFLRLLHDGARMERKDVRVLTTFGQPADYPVLPVIPESAYLKVMVAALV